MARIFIPPPRVAERAFIGLQWRRQYKRGGTSVGVRRAVQLSNRQGVSLNTIRRMVSYFARHEVDSNSAAFSDVYHPKYPSAGRIAWELWGGDAGREWCRRVWEQWGTTSKGID